jgi:hypothetical protein
MSVREWCEKEDSTSMTITSRWQLQGLHLQDFKTRDKNSIHTTGWRMDWRVSWGNQGITPGCMGKCHDILQKASPRLKEMEEYFMPGSLPVQPQVIMGSGLVDLSCDSGGTVASRCSWKVGLDGHCPWSGKLSERPCFVCPVLKHPAVRGHKREGMVLVGKVHKTLQSKT